MKIFPYENYILKSSRTPSELIALLNENVEPVKSSSFSENRIKKFQGVITGDKFQITRIINYRNSFIPVITGEIFSNGGYSDIHIKMKLDKFVLIFMAFWLSLPVFFFLTTLEDFYNNFRGFQNIDPFLYLPPVMIIFGIAICTIPFKSEAGMAKKILSGIFEEVNVNENKTAIIEEHL
jgi:hypothetical protein